jgi:uncharacterized membrane protein
MGVMAVFLALVLGSVAARATVADTWPVAIAAGLALMFTMTGLAHFAPGMRRDMIAIVPPRLPHPGRLVTVTGMLELVGAAGLLYPPTRVAAAICLFVLMLAMFPANVYAARMPDPPASMTANLAVRAAEEAVYLAAAVVVAVGGGQ